MVIYVCCGMISSGKSTYCNQRAKERYIVLNDDSIIYAVHGGNYKLYSKELKPLYKSIEDHILHTAVAMKKNVVIDRGVDVSKASRERWIAIGRSLDVPVKAIVFTLFSPEIHAKRRFEADNRGYNYKYWLEVATSHLSRYEQPNISEGFSEIIFQEWK